MASPALIPELDVTDLAVSLEFYIHVLGFSMRYRREEEQFAYLVHGDVHLMLEGLHGSGRRFHETSIRRPFGQGMNLQIQVDDVRAIHGRIQKNHIPLVVDLEQRWYRVNEGEGGNEQFVVADPDGYLLRFFTDLGNRPTSPADE
jgi:catechol 2,3-dioxygenase-like lactoylglutathione lyase family enzyme